MALHFVSKTGLVASPKKNIHSTRKKDDYPNLSNCAIARPVQFSLRPFGGLYNPYAKGCSILCNHPGPNEVKTVVRQAKDAWLHDTRPHLHDDRSSMAATSASPYCTNAIDAGDLPEHVPEEFFRRYTGSDSRPMTPTPTVASGRTRTSTGSHVHAAVAAARRCFTPDPGVHSGVKERKQLILDLRRSQSQETLYWNASSELTPTTKVTGNKMATMADKSGAGGPATKAGGSSPMMARSKSARSLRLCEQEAKRRAEEKLKAEQEAAALLPPPAAVCINAMDEYDDGEDEAPRRRGKRKKKSNKPPTTATYKVSQEPETQIATLGPDSPNQSNRPSLVPNGPNAPCAALLGVGDAGGVGGWAGGAMATASGGASVRQSSFISEEAMKYLRRGLNIDVLEGAFDRYMNLALTEAIRTVPHDQLDRPSEALLAYQAAHPTVAVDPAKWLSMPRKYTRKSVRFTLPINTYDLETLTPFQYVSQHVWLSAYRKELCRYVFAKHQPAIGGGGGDGGVGGATAVVVAAAVDDEKVNDPLVERTLSCATDLDAALGDVLGFYGTPERIGEIRAMLGLGAEEAITDETTTTLTMNFRSWCGVVAFGERYLNTLAREADPCDEIEVADFTSLERKFANVNVSAPMQRLLTWIKYN